MAKSRLSFSSRSLAALGAMMIISQSYQPMIVMLHHRGQTAAWLLALLAALLTALCLWPVIALLRSIPGGTLLDLARIAFGRPGLIVTALLMSSALCFAGGLILRETSEMALSAAFPHSPQTFATTSLLLGAVVVAFGEGNVLVRLGSIILPVLTLSILGVLLGALGWGQWATILPFWGPGPLELLVETPAMTKFYAPAAILLLLTGYVNDRKHLVRSTLAVPILTGLLLALVKLVLGVVFPYPLSDDITYPMHAAARIVIGGRFLERVEGVWLMMWVISTIILVGAFLFASATMISRAFRMPKHRTAILPLATVILTVAFFPGNQADTLRLHIFVSGPYGLVLLGLPLLLTAVAFFRRRGVSHAA